LTIFHTFSLVGWALSLASLLITSLLLFGAEKWLGTGKGTKVQSVLLYFYGYLVAQSVCLDLKAKTSEFILWNWLCYGFVLGACYCSSLQALIVSPSFSPVPQTLDELANSDYEWGSYRVFLERSLAGSIFSESENPVVKRIYKHIQTNDDQLECLEKAARTNYACFAFGLTAKFFIAQYFTDNADNHPFQVARESLFSTGTAFATRKREIYMKHFKDFISRSFCMGLAKQIWINDNRKVRKQKLMESSKRVQSFSLEASGPRPFSMENVKAAFLILLVGIFIAASRFIFEVACALSLFKESKMAFGCV